MKKRLFTIILLATTMAMQAQRIDLNNSQNRTEEGYTAWTIGTTTRATISVDGITIVATIDGIQQSRTLKGEWWKDGVNKHSKLVCDGVGVYGLDGNNNTPQLQEGETGIKLTITGLSAGTHSLLAYHNNPSGYQGPNLKVLVDGTEVLTDVVQTNRAQTTTQSGQSYIKFTAQEGQAVEVIYRTTPDPTFDYTQGYNTTSLFINGLIFDRPNPLTTASTPMPEHLDWHANCDGHRATFTWTAAATAVKHHVMLGTDASNLEELATVQTTSYEVANLSPMQTYYWRIDEEDKDGNRYEGDTWQFRPRRLAFPDAEGYGRFAIGGRGGTVYHVTSLEDNGSDTDPLPGTFRYGIKKVTGPRTIVFDVAGTIYLQSRLTCSDPYVTIAGQTAPGRGIMLRGCPFGMASDGITRFIRMRRGHILDEADANKGLDGLGMAGNDHSIMDHCSISWTIDEGFSSRGAKHITLQRTLISEALNVAGHPNYPAGTAHGYAATIGGGEYGAVGSSFHHNLLAHNEGRNWSLSGGLDGAGAYDGHHDIFNNVVYNWGGRATDGGTHEGQFVSNYYKMGPATTQTFLLNAQLEGTGSGSQAYYVTGNIRESTGKAKTQDHQGDTYKYTLSGGQQLDWTVFVDKPFFESYATVETATQAFQNVLSDVGCNQPELDNHDSRMIQETLWGTTSTVGSKSKKKGLIDHEDDAGGFAALNIIDAAWPADWDSDQDGVPDWYERVVGTDPAVVDNNGDVNQNDYTNLEDYLEFLAHPHFVIKPGTAFALDLRPYFTGYQSFTIEESSWASEGFTGYFEGSVLHLNVTKPLLRSIAITVIDSNSGNRMTRLFYFCATDEASGIYAPSLNSREGTRNNNPLYDLHGRKLTSQLKKGLNIQQGRKYLSF